MLNEYFVSISLAPSREYERTNGMFANTIPGQRRKEHLSKLEQAQREAQSQQSDEVERLRRENQALQAENETLRATYGSQASSPGPAISPTSMGQPSTAYLPYGPPSAYLEAAATTTPVSMSNTPTMPVMQDPGSLVVIMPNNIREIRRSLHTLFAPLLDITVISNPQNHLTTLQAMSASLPTALKPTQLQLTTPHHAYIDLIPSRRLRDQLIALGATHANVFLMDVCTLVCDIEDTGQMTVWGEDWLNEFSWEFSATALDRYGGWLLGPEWGQRANFWRRQRGAPTLPGYD
jgi:hypothetical protein